MIQIDFVAFEELMKKEKLKNQSQLAKRMNISRAQVSRVFKGQCAPGEAFIAKFKEAFPKAKFEKYFFTQGVA